MTEPDPMAERRRNSSAHYDALDAMAAARPAQPTHITRTIALDPGLMVTVDDGRDTTVIVSATEDGRIVLTVSDHGMPATVDLTLHAASVVVDALSAVAGLTPEHAAPITGSR